jgi:hypothetical protein
MDHPTCGVCQTLASAGLYERAVGAGELPIDRVEVARVSEAYRPALAAAPRPW